MFFCNKDKTSNAEIFTTAFRAPILQVGLRVEKENLTNL